MSTAVQGLEKEFILKAFYNEDISIVYIYNREEYKLKIEKLTKSEIFFKTDHNLLGLINGERLDLTADYKGVIVVFVVEISQIAQNRLITTIPESLYKNLDRSSPRVNFPTDMQLKFSFLDERYSLPFSEVDQVTPQDAENILPDPDLTNFNDILARMDSWIKEYADEYKLVLFRESKTLTLEEQIIIKTRKTLFLPSSKDRLPQSDPYPKKRLITQEIFMQYLESIGVVPVYFNAAIEQFIESKRAYHILSDLWIPLSFKEYTAGYIHVWVNQEEKSSLDHTVIEILYQYANSLVLSLKNKGYFDSFSLKNKLLDAQGVDISIGGCRFTYPQESYISDILILDKDLMIKLITPKRTISVSTKILRRSEEKSSVFLGCHFLDLVPEDIRFLYEYIYGKPFIDLGNAFF